MKFCLALLLVLFCVDLKAQDVDLVYIEDMPHFPGGDMAFQKYLDSAIVYPDTAVKYGREGTVYVYFEVDKDGTCGNFKIKKGVPNAPELSIEALRVIRMMPRWIPGKMGGKPVKVSMTVPVKFKLPE
jgi:periplasmic protein TonB